MFVFLPKLNFLLIPHPAAHTTWANQNVHSLKSCQEPLSELIVASHAIYGGAKAFPPRQEERRVPQTPALGLPGGSRSSPAAQGLKRV